MPEQLFRDDTVDIKDISVTHHEAENMNQPFDIRSELQPSDLAFLADGLEQYRRQYAFPLYFEAAFTANFLFPGQIEMSDLKDNELTSIIERIDDMSLNRQYTSLAILCGRMMVTQPRWMKQARNAFTPRIMSRVQRIKEIVGDAHDDIAKLSAYCFGLEAVLPSQNLVDDDLYRRMLDQERSCFDRGLIGAYSEGMAYTRLASPERWSSQDISGKWPVLLNTFRVTYDKAGLKTNALRIASELCILAARELVFTDDGVRLIFSDDETTNASTELPLERRY